MGDYEFRVSTNMKFDSQKEQNIIEYLNKLSGEHRLGGFLSAAVKFVMDNPKLVTAFGFDTRNYGVTEERRKYLDHMEHELREISVSQQEVRDMANKMFILAECGKLKGEELQSCAKDVAWSQRIIDDRTERLKKMLGISSLEHKNVSESTEEELRKLSCEVMQLMDIREAQEDRHEVTVQECNGIGEGAVKELGDVITSAIDRLTQAISEIKIVGAVSNEYKEDDITEIAKLSSGSTSNEEIIEEELPEHLKEEARKIDSESEENKFDNVEIDFNGDFDALAAFIGM